MEPIHWDKSYETGFNGIDNQHSFLIGLINDFSELLRENEFQSDRIENIYNELKEYTVYHFQEEEKIMEEHEIDPQFQTKHIEAHLYFLFKLTDLHDEILSRDPTAIRELFDFLMRWLNEHILGMDQNIVRHFKSIEKD